MRRFSFFTTLLLGNLLLVAIIISIGGSLAYRFLNQNYQRENRASQRRTAEIAQHYVQQIWPVTTESLDHEVKTLFADRDMRMTVITRDGRVLADSQADAATMENHDTPDRPEVRNALNGQTAEETRLSETLGIPFRYYARPFYQEDKVVGVVRIAMPIRAIAEGRGLIIRTLIYSALIPVSIALTLALLLSWIWYRPLRLITRAAGRIAGGDLKRRVHIGGSDELATLAGALNEMRKNLAEKIRQIATQREYLQTVVSNLREGVIALDARGRIVLLNEAARSLLVERGDDPTGKQLQECVRIAEVAEAFSEVINSGQPVHEQFETQVATQRRTVDLLAVRLEESDADSIAALIVARDISDLARMAAVKAEFVANASHELRTPLATLRAGIESLGSISPADREEFKKVVQILDRGAARLEDMTNDLLDLRMIESSKQQLKLEDIALNSFADWLKEQFASKSEQKDLILDISVEPKNASLRSDRTLLRLVLQNLIDNAIKFTDPGGKVSCTIQHLGDYASIEVTDTGCGIPSKLQARVFERFFQAESSRSGDTKARGTGLGLAIVKHACERLDAKIDLESEPNVGTTISVRIPHRVTYRNGGA